MVGPLPETARGRPAKDGLHTSPAAIVTDPADTALWRALADRYRAGLEHGYDRGFDDGRATACVTLAEIEERYQAIAWRREWSARLQRIIQADTAPSARMRQVMAEIAADQAFMREARARLAEKPWTLSPLEWCALHRVRPVRLRPGGWRRVLQRVAAYISAPMLNRVVSPNMVITPARLCHMGRWSLTMRIESVPSLPAIHSCISSSAGSAR